MVVYTASLIISLFLLCSPALGGQQRQLCLKCHPSHYAALGSCVACHRGNPSAERINVAHYRMIAGRFAAFTLGDVPVVKEGNRLMDQYACRRCHVSGRRGNRLATPLDTLIDEKTPEEIAEAIRGPAQGMPNFRLSEKSVVAVVNAIFAGGKKAGVTQGNRPLLVHFDAERKGQENVFIRKCGTCHRALTEKLGLIGSGDIGPNLSGLLSSHYPKTFKTSEAWTEDRLKRWLENPRKVRPLAQMLPVQLKAGEFRELVDLLQVKQVDGK